MGWTGMRDFGQKAIDEGREFIRRNNASKTCHWPWEIVKDAEVKTRNYNRGVYYAALRNIETNEKFIFVMLCESLHGWFRYKDLDESAVPEAKCPIEIIEAAGPTENKYAIQWRQACYRYAHREMPDYRQMTLF